MLKRATRKATEIAPGMMVAWRGWGHALWRMGDVEGARRALARALRLAPGDARTIQLLEQLRER